MKEIICDENQKLMKKSMSYGKEITKCLKKIDGIIALFIILSSFFFLYYYSYQFRVSLTTEASYMTALKQIYNVHIELDTNSRK